MVLNTALILVQLGMYIRRRKNNIDGVFQASSFVNKPPNSSGLRVGGYFLSLEVCQTMKNFYDSKILRPKQKTEDSVMSSNPVVKPKSSEVKELYYDSPMSTHSAPLPLTSSAPVQAYETQPPPLPTLSYPPIAYSTRVSSTSASIYHPQQYPPPPSYPYMYTQSQSHQHQHQYHYTDYYYY
jgi:hypothetical protein